MALQLHHRLCGRHRPAERRLEDLDLLVDQHAERLQTLQRGHSQFKDAVDDEQGEDCFERVAGPIHVKIGLIREVFLNPTGTKEEQGQTDNRAAKPYTQERQKKFKLPGSLAAYKEVNHHPAESGLYVFEMQT